MIDITQAQRDALTPSTRAAVDRFERAAAGLDDVFAEFNRWIATPGFSLETGAARAVIEEFTRIAEFAPHNDLIREINMDLALCRQGYKDGPGAML